jgi:3-hydroxyacyl-CoA dehydrogenase/enoyl-CoA hydratase/3-hydroxybutyryl-CoA epimerase/enoyl-CoA isomerase
MTPAASARRTAKGFYAYEQDKKGKPKKVADAACYELLAPIAAEAGL